MGQLLKGLLTLIIFAAVLVVPAAAGEPKPAEAGKDTGAAKADDVIVCVNYFAGWWEPLPNKWYSVGGRDWRPKYPNRVPLMGCFNNQPTMDREIVCAASHGVDAFAILWYFHGMNSEPESHSWYLNQGVITFTDSPEAHRMKFFIEYCNGGDYAATKDSEWDVAVLAWIEAMRHPSYLRVDGKLVFKFITTGELIGQCGGIEGAKKRLTWLRGKVREAGLGEMLIGGGIGTGDVVNAEHDSAKLFDFTGIYMDLPGDPRAAEDFPYEKLDDFAAATRKRHNGDAIAHVPYVAAGWSPKPWSDSRAYYALPTREQWVKALRRMKQDLAENDKLGLPLSGGKRQKMFTIYAWNEFGEGGFVAPTYGDGFMKLEGIREVFGK